MYREKGPNQAETVQEWLVWKWSRRVAERLALQWGALPPSCLLLTERDVFARRRRSLPARLRRRQRGSALWSSIFRTVLATMRMQVWPGLQKPARRERWRFVVGRVGAPAECWELWSAWQRSACL